MTKPICAILILMLFLMGGATSLAGAAEKVPTPEKKPSFRSSRLGKVQTQGVRPPTPTPEPEEQEAQPAQAEAAAAPEEAAPAGEAEADATPAPPAPATPPVVPAPNPVARPVAPVVPTPPPTPMARPAAPRPTPPAQGGNEAVSPVADPNATPAPTPPSPPKAAPVRPDAMPKPAFPQQVSEPSDTPGVKPAGEAAQGEAGAQAGAGLIELPPASMGFDMILSEIKDQTGITIITHGKMPDKVTAGGEGMTIETVLNKICGPNKLQWTKTPDGTGYELWDEQTYREDYQIQQTEQKIFTPQHIDAEFFSEAVTKANLLTKNVGSIQTDKRTNQVIVIDMPGVLARVQALLDLLDVALVTRVFYIKYANIEELVKKLEEYKSEPGTIEVDEKLRLVIVKDVLANIQRMESVVELLDKRQPRKVYMLNSVDIEGEEFEMLDEQIQALASKDAYYLIDEKRGLLILEDSEEVHEEVEKFLKVFNRTVDQVLVQIELLDVSQSNSLKYGTKVDYTYKGLLPTTSSATTVLESELKRRFSASSGSDGLTMDYAGLHLGGLVTAQLQAALSDNNTRVLMRPRLLIKSGVDATIDSTVQNPIANSNYSSGYYNNYNNDDDNNSSYYSRYGGYGGISQSTVPSGLEITLTPLISPTGLVEMEVSINNSDSQQVEINAGVGTNNTVTAYRITKDSVETTLIIPDGETRVISGINRQSKSDGAAGIPLLVKIPWIGPLLFGNKTNNSKKQDLMFFITPTIVREVAKGSIAPLEFGAVNTHESDEAVSASAAEPSADSTDAQTQAEAAFERPVTEEERRTEARSEATSITLPSRELFPDDGLLEQRRFTAPLPQEKETPPPAQPGGEKADAAGTPAPSEALLEGAGLLARDREQNTEAGVRKALGGALPDLATEPKVLGAGVKETISSKKGKVTGVEEKPAPAGTTPTPAAKPTPKPGATPAPGAKPTPKPTPTPAPGAAKPTPAATPAPTPRPAAATPTPQPQQEEVAP